jgi:hypothetical protein
MNFPTRTPYVSGGHASLSIDGQFFRLNEELWTGIASSEFSLPKRFLMNEEIRPVLDERAELGFNELRLWWLNQSVVGQVYPEGIHPDQHGNFYEKMRELNELIGSYQIVGENTIFTSCDPLMREEDRQHTHWNKSQDALRGLGNVKLELANEYNWGQGQNAPHESLYSMRPQGIIASNGSAVSDSWPREPHWDYVLYHANGLSEWPRKVGHNCMEIAVAVKKPGASNENTRYMDGDTSTVHAYDAAAGAALLCAGATFHSVGGKLSQLFSAYETAAAKAWVAGALSVPLRFQRAQYFHRDDLEPQNNPNCDPSVIRIYEKRLPTESHFVEIHK